MEEKNNMRIETNHITIRDFERKDAENLYQIVREKNILRFMPDWVENNNSAKAFWGYIDCANIHSCHLAEKCGFELFEKRTPMGHKQPNMESDSYFYYRRYRNLE